MKAKTKGKFPQVAPGEWVTPVRRGYLMECCDCGLIHRFNFRIVKDARGRNKIQWQAFRHNRKVVVCPASCKNPDHKHA